MAVFGSVSRLTVGDIIEVDYDGITYAYRVRWTEQFGADYNNWGEIWSSDVPVDSITLYTCGGEFDRATRSYSDRFVVRAERI
jgi:sortase (surface protein transpeptidase)